MNNYAYYVAVKRTKIFELLTCWF